MARSMFSFGIFEALALSSASRKRMLASGLPPPSRAATVTSRPRRVNILPRFASRAPFLRLIVAHFECPDIGTPPHCCYHEQFVSFDLKSLYLTVTTLSKRQIPAQIREMSLK